MNKTPLQFEKYKKWFEIMKKLDTFSTKEEFLRSFEAQMKHILNLEKKLIEKNSKELDSLKELFNKFNQTKGVDFDKIKSEAKTFTDKLFKEQQGNLNFIYDKVSKLKSGKNGHTPTKEELSKLLKDLLPEIETPKQTRDKLETLLGEEELKLTVIEKLEKKIEELEKRPLGGRTPYGGSVVHKFSDDETPTGTVNGSTTAFTLAKAPINNSLDVYVNGMRMTITEDYTLSAKTITFVTAPPTGSIVRCNYRHF